MNHPQIKYSCDTTSQPLLSVSEALKILIDAALTSQKNTCLKLDDALGRVLFRDVRAQINVPQFDNSAMDGYALALAPEQINTTGVLTFKITDRIPAGAMGKPLDTGCAARIFTGAPIPDGANTVIMQEECQVLAGETQLETWRPLLLGEHIRPQGGDILKEAIILPAGTELKPQHIALSASIGVDKLAVFKTIKVGVFSTGNELIEPGNKLSAGKIFNSNRYSLLALLKKMNCEVLDLGNIKDDFDAVYSALDTLKTDCDLIITTGGVSVGEEDYVRPVIKKLGELSLWNIRMKPGRPLAFGKIGKTAFIGLPGNSVSTMVTFLLFARPFIKKMQGQKNYQNQTIKVQTDFNWQQARARREFVRVQLNRVTTPATVSLYPKQDSNILTSLVWADGLVEIAENATFSQGQILDFYSLTEMLS